MTILAPTPTPQHTSVLTGFDVLDITEALRNAAANNTTTLNAADRQALALLTYDRTVCKAMPAWLIERILDGTYELPVDELRARLLLRLIDRLPAVSQADEHAWLANREKTDDNPVGRALRIIAGQTAMRARNPRAGNVKAALKWTMRILIEETARSNTPYNPVTDTDVQAAHERVTRLVEEATLRHNQPPTPDPLPDTEQIITALAGLVADLSPQPGSHLLESALRTAVRIARPDVPARQVETVADDLVEQARKDLMAAEYGETPAAVNA